MTDLQHEALRSGDTGALVVLEGEIDVENAGSVGEAIMSARRGEGSSVVVDMTDVTFMDSQGLKVLLIARQDLAAEGGLLRLRRPPECVLLVLELTGVRELFSIDA